MTTKSWSRRYLAYCRAHGIDYTNGMALAEDVRVWVASQADIFRREMPGSLDFDGWLSARFPEADAVAA